ncbi:MAG: hypothetical protein GTO63_35140, partial [Anaerolineae bacterium]|nr:hypothetical protein [Anaerolineae bacterium]NIN99933.1 hypothetical protein [Anaerolineae bacterium]
MPNGNERRDLNQELRALSEGGPAQAPGTVTPGESANFLERLFGSLPSVSIPSLTQLQAQQDVQEQFPAPTAEDLLAVRPVPLGLTGQLAQFFEGLGPLARQAGAAVQTARVAKQREELLNTPISQLPPERVELMKRVFGLSDDSTLKDAINVAGTRPGG